MATKKAPAKKKAAAPAGGDDSPDPADDAGSGGVAEPVKHRTDDEAVPLVRHLAERRAALRR